MVNNLRKTDPINPSEKVLDEASGIIRKGGIVAFPTETVYGLGADATNDSACLRIFEAKGRQSDNPLIVHISDFDQLSEISGGVSHAVLQRLEQVWPGPLTIVLPNRKAGKVATVGLGTVAVRMPAHKIPLEIIRRSGKPIAAPSANKSGRPSPVTAREVVEDLGDKADLVIDGGKSFFGVESTVIQIRPDDILILRPGAFNAEDVKKLFQMKVRISGMQSDSPISPGMKYRHYAPSKKLILAPDENYILEKCESGGNFAVLGSKELAAKLNCETIVLGSRNDLYEVARNLFPSFRMLDRGKFEYGIIEPFEERGIGLAIMNRIRKASEG